MARTFRGAIWIKQTSSRYSGAEIMRCGLSSRSTRTPATRTAKARSGHSPEEGHTLDWKAIPNYVLLVGLFVAMVTMFNQVNGRIDAMNGRIDTMQTENNRRFDNVNLRFDAMQTEMDRRFDNVNPAVRRHAGRDGPAVRRDEPAVRPGVGGAGLFEGRITRLEEKAGVGPGNPD